MDQSLLYFSSLVWASGVLSALKGVFDCLIRIITTEDRCCIETTFDIIEKYKPNFIAAPPGRYLTDLAEHERIATTDMSCLKVIITAGSILTDTLKEKVKRYIPNVLVGNIYGLSEIGGSVSCNFILQRGNSAGHLLPNMRGKVVDENGNRLGIGETGELCLKFSQPCLGYYNNEEASKALLDSDGWLKSGDLGYFDKDGFLFIVDRKKEVFKNLGYQIYPGELEEFLIVHEDIKEICVTSIPSEEEQTNLPAAVVVRRPNPKLSEDDIAKFADLKITSIYKKLRGGIYFTDQLPKTINGKLQRRLVQKFAIDEYNKRHSKS